MLLVFRVMKSLSNMQQLIDTVLQNLPAMCNISMVLGLLLFVYAIMGMQLFASVQTVNQEVGRFIVLKIVLKKGINFRLIIRSCQCVQISKVFRILF